MFLPLCLHLVDYTMYVDLVIQLHVQLAAVSTQYVLCPKYQAFCVVTSLMHVLYNDFSITRN
jgi:hypothetical protein